MVRRVVLAVVISGVLVHQVFADHLGPIILGVERIEKVVYCTTKDAAMTLAIEEEKSRSLGEPLEKYLNTIKPLMLTQCGMDRIRYTPQVSIYQWEGMKTYPDGRTELVLMTLIKATSGGREIYVITGDLAPVPSITP